MRAFLHIAVPCFVALAAAACSSSSSTNLGPGGGPVSGAADDHCAAEGNSAGTPTQTVNEASCYVTDAGTTDDGGGTDDAGAMDGMDMSDNDYGATMYGTEGDDDDCKYHVSYTVTPTHSGQGSTFVVTVTNLSTQEPVTDIPGGAGQGLIIEADLGTTHASAHPGDLSVQTSPGVYTVNNVLFDASGRWTVRFHIHEECADVLDDSPHGHAAFYIDVP